MRSILVFIALLFVTACSQRPGDNVLVPYVDIGDDAEIIRLFVVSSRTPTEYGYNASFDFATGFRYYDISVPPERTEGSIKWPNLDPDPVTDFLVVDTGTLTREEFIRQVHRDNLGDGEVGVFVHGFNQRFQEALFRVAQLNADSDSDTVASVLFSWPSEGNPLGYETDAQGVLFSRDPLADLLTDLHDTGLRTVVFAHSMGGWLTVEALRILKLAGRQDVLDGLEVILAAPDVDTFVFGRAMDLIGPMKTPIAVLVSRKDRALDLAARLAGGRPKLGSVDVTDPAVAEAAQLAHVQLIDISSVDFDPLGHSGYIGVAQHYSELQQADSGRGDFASTGAFVFNAFENAVIQPVSGAFYR
ncbi:alpha/beta fold hydrolase [Marivivens donghaensis]|uniref:Alpha/beta fold hydrolase n=1 Tax=Marivivens donghaensis TaxID=1699413 RepID=A0ABX0VX47_9RHOB|nr:alpha/beta fold hydrolase [Marivivens donghaensis]NIY71203.1 alpha/beta fold hydrolase [Marivivens donghaensis]